MNHLNSVLLEGVVIGEVAKQVEFGRMKDVFTVESTRHETKDKTKKFTFKVHSQLATEPITGQTIRVVGRLVSYNKSTVIYAEHIDFKG